MYFFASSLLLLVASTIYASPVRIESRGEAMSHLTRWTVSERFHHEGSRRIPGWSDPDEVREPIGYRAHQPLTIIKRVDLSTVEVPEHGLTAEEKLHAQRTLMFKEKWLFEVYEMFRDWEWVTEEINGEKKEFVYLEINKPGTPALASFVTDKEKDAAIADGLWILEYECSIVIDEAYRKDYRYWGILDAERIKSGVILLRYAKTVPKLSPAPINHQWQSGRGRGEWIKFPLYLSTFCVCDAVISTVTVVIKRTFQSCQRPMLPNCKFSL